MPVKIIDIHSHIISTDTRRYPIAPLGGKQSVWSHERPASFEQMITSMDEAKVDKSVIVQASTVYSYDNSYVADCIALQPKRFTGVFSIDILADDAPKQIRYWVGKKLIGLRLFTTGSTMNTQATWLEDPKSFPGWECASELGIPICVQMRPEGMPQLIVLLKRFPRTKIILDHMLGVGFDENYPFEASSILFDLAKYSNIYLKMTTLNIKPMMKTKGTAETFLPLLVKEFGASRIAWGSNFPAAEGTLREIVTNAENVLSVLPEKDQEWIFHRTAEILYPVLAEK